MPPCRISHPQRLCGIKDVVIFSATYYVMAGTFAASAAADMAPDTGGQIKTLQRERRAMAEEDVVQEIMLEFAGRTGLQGSGPVRRYLWTDAYAVCNFLGLYRQTGREKYLHLALDLVDQVHETLGRHRDDDPRSGWISGLDNGVGQLHPTAGGLRIGKRSAERPAGEPFDEKLEWERDGQYYHYLTKWMHGLCCTARVIGNPVYVTWARELAERAHNAFCQSGPGDAKHLYWKMSIDLSRPQVTSMGHHDPLEGLVTCLEIRQQEEKESGTGETLLAVVIKDLADMCRGSGWTTPDPLGVGGLLVDGWRLAQLQGAETEIPVAGLLEEMLDAAAVGLSIFTRDNTLHLPASSRLAFRELGLSIGLQAIVRIESLVSRFPEAFSRQTRLGSLLDALQHYLDLREQIEDFWLVPENMAVPAWNDHADINMVMLATSLAPEGFLDL